MHKLSKNSARKIGCLFVSGIMATVLSVTALPGMGIAGFSYVFAEETEGEEPEAEETKTEYSYSDFKAGKNIEDIDLSEFEIIEISNEEEWAEFAKNCELDAWSTDKYVKLTADIKLISGIDAFVPTFGGIFDGDGHSVTNVNITGAGSAYGLFRYLQTGGIIENLAVSGSISVDYSAGRVGLIVGENYGTVTGCHVSGIVNGENEVGGIAGYNAETGIINGCASKCQVNGTHSVGGVVGSNDGIVSECGNEGAVNTVETEATIDITEISMENIAAANSTTNAAAFTDVGGIAGISAGTIISCSNIGIVGYEHVGYNVGGIVGRISQGYVYDCVNKGKVRGRKDVGGIAGQMEPFLQMEYMVDGIGRLNQEVETLLAMMNEAADDLEYYGDKTSKVLGEMSDALLDANQISKELPDDEEGTSIDEMKEEIDGVRGNLLTLAEDMDVIADYSSELSDIINNGNKELTADLRAIVNQATLISSLSASIRADVFSYQGIDFSDTSAEIPVDAGESEMSNNGKLVSCVNYGSVEADTAVGGIVGRIATEYDANLEDDVLISGEHSLYMSATAKAVVKDCINYATITSKKDYAGGIVGFARYGALISDTGAGNVYSESGSYIGGVAGESDSNIITCYACGKVTGKSYVGGIAGKGMNISGSVALCEITFEGERAGAVAGMIADDGVISDNYYVDAEVGGVDGISYMGGAVEVEYDELKEIPGLPEEFTEFSIIFLVDGEEIGRITTTYGGKVDEDKIPAIPEKEGCFGVWPDYDFDNVKGSAVLEAVYEKWMGSVQSAETITVNDVQKPVVMVVGDFLPGAELVLTVSGNEYTYSVSYPENSQLAKEMGLTQYEGTVNVRVAAGDMNPDDIVVEKYADGNWVKAETTVIGSYISFEATAPGKFRVTEVKDYSKYFILAGILVAIIIVVILLLIINKAKKLKKKMMLKKTPKAVIFDLDGTIIDTEKYYRRVWPQALEHFGYHLTDAQVLELRSLGRPFAPKKFKEWFGESFDYDTVRNYRKKLFEQCIKEEGVALKPGIKELLDELRARNITIAIATATDVERTTRYLDMVGITEYFDKICSAANVKEGKPSPDVYIEACKQLKLYPEACFAVEDAPNGIKSAASAGCRVIFVPDQTKDEPDAEKMVFAKVNTADEIIGLL